jgi:hypothetical protein
MSKNCTHRFCYIYGCDVLRISVRAFASIIYSPQVNFDAQALLCKAILTRPAFHLRLIIIAHYISSYVGRWVLVYH